MGFFDSFSSILTGGLSDRFNSGSGSSQQPTQTQTQTQELEYPGLIMPSFPAMNYDTSGMEAMMAQQAADAAQAQKRAERIAGQNSRDALYSQHMDAAGTAIDVVNQQISQELANARLLGIDYDITDEQKDRRISDYFASIWGEGQQSELETLFDRWGKPKGFEGFVVERGDGSGIAIEMPEREQVGVSQGQKPKTMLARDDEEVLGSGATVLGS